MSEENKDLGDKAKDAAKGAKKSAKEFAKDAKESAKEFAEDTKEAAKEFKEDTKEAAKDFGQEAKKTADEFKEGLASAGGDNKKLLAGILAILFGWLGVHKFILGYQKEGIIMAVVGVLGWFLCGIPTMLVSIVGLIEGIMYLTKSDEEFYNTYQAGRKPWF
ncbi:MAG: NINE protein [Arenibacter algicola]|nr:NINE protein [Arenibacter algicola]|tara:strand:+ start:25471 stop:25956 length:486 start_codon:yes stop_codon:yes gene_type:complete